MNVEETFFGTLSNDLMIEIFSRLPSKSIARFRCLSKQWASILTSNSPYFTELFLTQSKTRPRLLFALHDKDKEWYLYSCPQPQISSTNSTSSISVTAEFHMSLHKSNLLNISPSILGLIYCSNMLENSNRPMFCNPRTRNFLWLPQHRRLPYSYFGYNPIDKQFILLSISFPLSSHQNYQISKLGSGKLSWRKIECPLDRHYPLEANICINGVLFYIAKSEHDDYRKIVCFDLNSEEFKFVDLPWPHWPKALVNFKGKLGGIYTNLVRFGEEGLNIELSLWVLEDMEKQEWSKQMYVLSSTLWNLQDPDVFIVGMTTTGEIVLTFCHTTNPLYVYFYNFEKNILQKLEINGLEEFKSSHGLQGCVDYVEDLKDLNFVFC